MKTEIPNCRLGKSGIIVSRIALGTMTFGARTDKKEAEKIFNEATNAGVNFIDTADTYAGGKSEEITGGLLKGKRDRFILATKVGNPTSSTLNFKGLSRRWIIQEVEASLKRLETDYLDILYLHKEDHGTPLEETARALADLRRAGKIRYFGISNFKAWRAVKLTQICNSEGTDGPIVSQPLYHLLNRTSEIEHIPACADLGIGIVTYSPTARGILTGKYTVNGPLPEDSRAATNDKRIMETEYNQDNIRAAEKIKKIAQKNNIDVAAFSTAWALSNPFVHSVVAGPRTIEQWRIYCRAVEYNITSDDHDKINNIVKPGSTAVPQYIDPAYPVEGFPKH